jgi:hypothetical protein
VADRPSSNEGQQEAAEPAVTPDPNLVKVLRRQQDVIQRRSRPHDAGGAAAPPHVAVLSLADHQAPVFPVNSPAPGAVLASKGDGQSVTWAALRGPDLIRGQAKSREGWIGTDHRGSCECGLHPKARRRGRVATTTTEATTRSAGS